MVRHHPHISRPFLPAIRHRRTRRFACNQVVLCKSLVGEAPACRVVDGRFGPWREKGVIGVLKGRNLKARLTQPVDELWDRRLGVRTFGFHKEEGVFGEKDFISPYVPHSYRQIFAGFEAAGLGQEDVFTDLGCGLGRPVFAAAHWGVKRAIGVDIIPELIEGAKASLAHSRLRDRDIAFVCANALEYSLADTSVLYCFHALNPHILSSVLARTRRERAGMAAPPRFRMIYVNPVYDEEVLAASGWLRRTAHLPAREESFSSIAAYATSIWESD
jgi:SAM-dependent methyltransferase